MAVRPPSPTPSPASRRWRRLAAATALVAAVGLAGAPSPASAETPQLPSPFWAKERAVSIAGTYRPIVGDFDDDGFDDVYWYAPGAVADHLWTGGGRTAHGAFTDRSNVRQITGEYEPLVGDFGGDEADDILFYGRGSAPDSLWIMARGRTRPVAVRSVAVNGDYRPKVVRSGGGAKDGVVWATPEPSSPVTIWTFVGSSPVSVRAAAGGMPVVGDYDGDGWDDVYWFAPGAAADRISWRTGPSTVTRLRADNVGGDYAVRALDTDADGIDDLHFQPHFGASATTTTRWTGDGDRTFTRSTVPAESGIPHVVRSHVLGTGDALVLTGLRDDLVATFGPEPAVRPTGNTDVGFGVVLFGRFTDGTHDDALLVDQGRGWSPRLYSAPPRP